MLLTENAEVTVYTAPKDRYKFKKNQEWKMLTGMANNVNSLESMFIFIRKVDPEKKAKVVFDAFVEIGPGDKNREFYKNTKDPSQLE